MEKLILASLFIENGSNKNLLFNELNESIFKTFKIGNISEEFYINWIKDNFNNDDEDIYESIKKLKQYSKESIDKNKISKLIEDLKKQNIEIYWNDEKYKLYKDNLDGIIFDLALIMKSLKIDPIEINNKITKITDVFLL